MYGRHVETGGGRRDLRGSGRLGIGRGGKGRMMVEEIGRRKKDKRKKGGGSCREGSGVGLEGREAGVERR